MSFIVVDGAPVIEAAAVAVADAVEAPTPLRAQALVEGKPHGKVTLVILLDTTGSMQPFLDGAVTTIEDAMVELNSPDLQVVVVCYEDHPPQGTKYVTNVIGPTNDVQSIVQRLKAENASGGGDGPEALDAALHEASQIFQGQPAEGETRICIILTDAPPHGIGLGGDGFPKGTLDVGGWDPLEEANALADKGVRIYSVVAPTALLGRTAAFYKGITEKTGGRVIPLAHPSDERGRSGLLQALYGAAAESRDEDNRAVAVGRLLDGRRDAHPDESMEDSQDAVYRSLAAGGSQTVELSVQEIKAEHSDIFRDSKTLDEVRILLENVTFEDHFTPVRGYDRIDTETDECDPVYGSLGADADDSEPCYRSLGCPVKRHASSGAASQELHYRSGVTLPSTETRSISKEDVVRALARCNSRTTTAQVR